jgi:hypothetical protein
MRLSGKTLFRIILINFMQVSGGEYEGYGEQEDIV